MNVNFICRPYTSADQELTKNFSSGNRYLDAFIADPQSALDTSYGKTYIFLFEDSHEIIGYYNITAGSVDVMLDGKTRVRSGGSIHINCFAVDKKYQKIAAAEQVSDMKRPFPHKREGAFVFPIESSRSDT